nr:hypothetical protein [Tanacetum cinerariifolium]
MDLTKAGENQFLQINELDKMRRDAYESFISYKERTKRLHDKQIKTPTNYEKGDKILLFNSCLRLFLEKLKSRWYGPFSVSKDMKNGSIELYDEDGNEFITNQQRVKPYQKDVLEGDINDDITLDDEGEDPGENSSQSPPHIDHHCCYGCGDSLDGIFCRKCTCESCGNGAHISYNCPPKVLIISIPKPCYNQNVDEFPQTLPSFHPKCYSRDENSFTYDSNLNFVDDSPNPPPQPSTYSYEFFRNDAHYGHDCPPQNCLAMIPFHFLKMSHFILMFHHPLVLLRNCNTPISRYLDRVMGGSGHGSVSGSGHGSIFGFASRVGVSRHFTRIKKIDSLLEQFDDELIILKSIPSGINEPDCDPEQEIHLIEKLLYDNSSPRPSKEFISDKIDAAIESFSPYPIPVEDSDSLKDEIDLSLTPDDSMPSGIEDDNYDSKGDIFEELFSNDSLSLPKNKSFHFDILSSPRPPAKPVNDDEIKPNLGILTVKVVGNITEHYVPMPRLLPTQPTYDSNHDKSPHFLSHWGLKAFQLSFESPMMIYGRNIPILNVPFLHFYPP